MTDNDRLELTRLLQRSRLVPTTWCPIKTDPVLKRPNGHLEQSVNYVSRNKMRILWAHVARQNPFNLERPLRNFMKRMCSKSALSWCIHLVRLGCAFVEVEGVLKFKVLTLYEGGGSLPPFFGDLLWDLRRCISLCKASIGNSHRLAGISIAGG